MQSKCDLRIEWFCSLLEGNIIDPLALSYQRKCQENFYGKIWLTDCDWLCR